MGFIVDKSGYLGAAAPDKATAPHTKPAAQGKGQKGHKMKSAGYWPCRNEIIKAHLDAPHKYEPFVELFDTEKLDAVRDHYGADLYKECYMDALDEVMTMSNVVTHLRMLGVDCKPIFTEDDCHVNFIAVFALGNTNADRINRLAKKHALNVLFQCPTH